MAMCHKEIRKIAREMAGVAYEELARDNMFHAKYPNQNQFIVRHWKNFVGEARKSLLAILGGSYPEAMKKDVFEIYVRDRELQAIEGSPVVGGMTH